jgi:hypothetical protein
MELVGMALLCVVLRRYVQVEVVVVLIEQAVLRSVVLQHSVYVT